MQPNSSWAGSVKAVAAVLRARIPENERELRMTYDALLKLQGYQPCDEIVVTLLHAGTRRAYYAVAPCAVLSGAA